MLRNLYLFLQKALDKACLQNFIITHLLLVIIFTVRSNLVVSLKSVTQKLSFKGHITLKNRPCFSVKYRQQNIYVGRFHPFVAHEGPQGEQSYSSTLLLTLALEGGEESASRPGRTLPLGKTRHPLYRRLGGPQGRSGQVRKISLPPEFDPRTLQSVAQSLYRLRYPAHEYLYYCSKRGSNFTFTSR